MKHNPTLYETGDAGRHSVGDVTLLPLDPCILVTECQETSVGSPPDYCERESTVAMPQPSWQYRGTALGSDCVYNTIYFDQLHIEIINIYIQQCATYLVHTHRDNVFTKT